ncbi:recombinase family protein [Phenylobacterium sp. J367]|uniref:recombinase family protein n=1 Tax=Phenylobacterium sp. J367 TaxID=2898435 RepID=UPI002151FBDD|nr:recombinase family protein [Phenylobacterium sp. J367]MCR5878797.1 recombinase family protein [Phenylobacterium sp. J367]
MKRAALYVRVSTDDQTIENQLLVLTEVARRSGWEIVHTFSDEGVSGAKGRDKRPGYNALLNAIARREVQIVAAWSVDRLGRSLPDLVSFLSDIQAKGCDLYLHQQAIDTSTPSGRMLFQMLGVFAEFERALVVSRVKAAHDRCRARGVRIGRPPIPRSRVEKVQKALQGGQSIRVVAASTGVSTATVQRVKRSMRMVQTIRQEAGRA